MKSEVTSISDDNSKTPLGLVGQFDAEELNEHDLRLKLFNFLNGKDFNDSEEPQYSRSWSELENED